MYVCVPFSLSIHPNSRHLGWLHVLAIVKNAVMNLCMQEPLSNSALISFGYVPRSRITGSYGRSAFNFLRNFHAVFHSGCTRSHSYQLCAKFPSAVSLPPHPYQHLLFVDFLMIAILRVAKIWKNLSVPSADEWIKKMW